MLGSEERLLRTPKASVADVEDISSPAGFKTRSGVEKSDRDKLELRIYISNAAKSKTAAATFGYLLEHVHFNTASA